MILTLADLRPKLTGEGVLAHKVCNTDSIIGGHQVDARRGSEAGLPQRDANLTKLSPVDRCPQAEH